MGSWGTGRKGEAFLSNPPKPLCSTSSGDTHPSILLFATCKYDALTNFIRCCVGDHTPSPRHHHPSTSRRPRHPSDATTRPSNSVNMFGAWDSIITLSPLLIFEQQSCLAQGMPVSGCDPKDVACLCTSMPYTDAVTACLTTNCTVVDSLRKSNPLISTQPR